VTLEIIERRIFERRVEKCPEEMEQDLPVLDQ
jgi:hypothetical protein